MNQYDAYLETLNLHISCVREAGAKIGVSRQQLLEHDASKFWPDEFEPYANYFFMPDGSPRKHESISDRNQSDFDYAWLHHIHFNKHHWQHWILKYDDGALHVLEMPYTYIHEMVADWMGASKAYTGDWDMTDWLQRNLAKIILHKETRKVLQNYLVKSLGYPPDIVNADEASYG